ncbi:MAG: 2,3-bisphosphoglycerate-independent phosphoglycerate mutase [Acidobacteriota bacterium]
MYPVALIVLDGWGYRESREGNAVANCNPENFNALFQNYPHTFLETSGESVGLPEGQIGNSEVGHLCLGAGRVVRQELSRINHSIKTGAFQKIDILNRVMDETKDGSLHFLGLLSSGGVHSHIDHLKSLLKMACRKNMKKIFVHAFLDGRDTPPKSAIEYVKEIESTIARFGCGRISTIMGRYYAMDRDNRWDRVEKAHRAMTEGEGFWFRSAVEAVEAGYSRGETDEFLKPSVIKEHTPASPASKSAADGLISDGDSLIFFNFRADRAREITRAFTEKDFKQFQRNRSPRLSHYLCFTMYDRKFDLPIVFPTEFPRNTFGEIVSNLKLPQLRIAETEKYAHVTFFFNGGRELVFDLEERILVPSPRVPTYDMKPEMSAIEVTEEVLKRTKEGKDRVIILNYANADMVGHTGVYEAAMKACKIVDECVGRVVRDILSKGGTSFITADHGNSEQMIDELTCQPHTAHTLNPVPAILVSEKHRGRTLKGPGILADVIPTLLDIMGIEKPPEMDGTSLLQK